MIAAIALLVATIVSRVFVGISASADYNPSWWHNFSPIAALALCGAIYLPRRWAFTLPLVSLFISDLVLNLHYQVSLVSMDMLWRYAALLAIGSFGWILRSNRRPHTVIGASLLGSAFFFFITNSASWLIDPAYAKTAAGWAQALTFGRADFNPPTWVFFRNSLVSDAVFTVLFLACVHFSRSRTETAPVVSMKHEPAPWC